MDANLKSFDFGRGYFLKEKDQWSSILTKVQGTYSEICTEEPIGMISLEQNKKKVVFWKYNLVHENIKTKEVIELPGKTIQIKTLIFFKGEQIYDLKTYWGAIADGKVIDIVSQGDLWASSKDVYKNWLNKLTRI